MAQRMQVTSVSDLSGEPAEETVRFALDEREYEIDLSGPEAEGMRRDLAGWIGHARKRQSPRRRGRKRQPSRSDLPDIRAYALARGHEVKERGRIPAQIVSEYDLLKELKVI